MGIKGYLALLTVTGLEMHMCDQRDFPEASKEALWDSEERETLLKQTPPVDCYWQPYNGPKRSCLRIKLTMCTEVWKMKRPKSLMISLNFVSAKLKANPYSFPLVCKLKVNLIF